MLIQVNSIILLLKINNFSKGVKIGKNVVSVFNERRSEVLRMWFAMLNSGLGTAWNPLRNCLKEPTEHL